MLDLSHFFMVGGLALTIVASVFYIVAAVKARAVENSRVLETVGGSAPAAPSSPVDVRGAVLAARYGTLVARLALAALGVCLVLRTIALGHGPFTNMYEFAVATGFGMLAALLLFEWRYRARTLAVVLLPVTALLLLYAATLEGPGARPLVPALQNSLLLTIHVIVAVFAYGAFAVGGAAGGLYLLRSYTAGSPDGRPGGDAKLEHYDRLGYKAVVVGFPLMTLTIVLGAVWAQIAWGSYWSWDPKETSSLLVWFVYGAFLHARTARGWVGRGSAWLLIIGILTVALTFFGNYFYTGLHTYAG